MKGCLKWLFIIIGAFFVLIVVIAVANPNSKTSGDSGTAAVAPEATPGIPNTPTPESWSPPIAELCGTNDTLTDVQQKSYGKEMEGKEVVNWQGEVYDVEGEAGAYAVIVNFAPSSLFGKNATVLGVPNDLAMTLKPKDKVTVNGTIADMGWNPFSEDLCTPLEIKGEIVLAQ